MLSRRNIFVRKDVVDRITVLQIVADITNTNATESLDTSAKFALRNSDTCTSLHIIANRNRVTKFIYLYKSKVKYSNESVSSTYSKCQGN